MTTLPRRSTYQIGRTDAIAALVSHMLRTGSDKASTTHTLRTAHDAGIITESDFTYICKVNGLNQP